MNFLVDINPDMKPIEYKMVLCKLNEEPIMTITNIIGLKYVGNFANIDELSFNIPFYRMESDGTQVKNERYDAIKGDMLILLNDMKFFYIHYAKETVSEDGAIYKEVQAYSREYELSQKRIVGYSGISKVIYDYTNGKDENGIENGIMNYVEKMCSWRVGYINANLLTKYRALDFSNSNLLQAFQEIQRAFGCLFQFNTIDKIIDIYEIDQLGTNRGLSITDKNFLRTLEKSIKSDDIKTRLYLYGRDNISIQKLSITGKSYIDNFSFYKTTDYMSQDLIDALNTYDTYVETKQGLFDGYLTQLNAKNVELGARNDELVALQTELKVIQSNLDIAISSGQPTGTIKTQETNKLAEISAKQSQITTLENQIKDIYVNINQIEIDTDMSKHFTEMQVRELDSFIREETFSDGNYTEDNLEELLAEGKKILNRISQPSIQFGVGVVDFLSVVECQHTWDKFVLGDKVRLHKKELNFDYEVRMVKYTHSPDSNDLDLNFSNTNSIDDSSLYLNEIIDSLKTTSANVDFSRYKWDKGENANFMITKYVDSNLDLAKQALIKAEGQRPIMDDRGYWGYRINPDGTINPKQLRMTNEVIAMTQDNWNTIDVAISPDKGINANLINGKLGQFAQVYANQIIVGNNGETISDEALGGNLIKQNFYYNRTKITEQEGIEVYDNLGRRVLQTGSFDSDGNGTKDMYGHVAYHEDGSLSALVRNGFLRKNQYGESFYLNDIEIIEDEIIWNDPSSEPTSINITIPQRFRNKNIRCFAIPSDTRFTFVDSAEQLDLYIKASGYNTSVSNPYVTVYGYTVAHTSSGRKYRGVKFFLIILAY